MSVGVSHDIFASLQRVGVLDSVNYPLKSDAGCTFTFIVVYSAVYRTATLVEGDDG